MPRRKAQKKYAQRSVIYLTFFILLSIPLIIFSLSQESFDTRNKAFEDLELSNEHQCLISLPNVNPYSLEVGKTVTIQVDARLTDDSISELQIYNSSGEIIYEESFENAPIEIATSFAFTPKVSGTIDMLGIIKKGQGGSVGCEISSPYDVQGLIAIANNSSPEFTSNPTSSDPSQNIQTENLYAYTLTATDPDGDRINYSYSFTPRADWLTPVIIEDGSNGSLTIKFQGSTDKAASYLANVYIHDGYSKHLQSQSWVISVSPNENDIPIVKIIDPVESLRVDQGDTFWTSWEASDLNHITKYELYITNNPAEESDWTTINNNIAYNTTSYNVDTSILSPGTYKLITKAIDNQDPAATGMGISPEIVVSQTAETESGQDDVVVLNQPQVVNMSPSSTEEITNERVTIKATIIASESAEIEENSISFTLDGKDITDSIKINKLSSSEYTLIYQPEEDLDTGLHKAEVSFLDSNEGDITKSWNFTIQTDIDSSTDTYTIFGYEVSKKIVLIVGIGILTVILALVTPFIIFSVWKGDKKDDETSPNDRIPPSTPKDDTMYMQPEISPTQEEIIAEPQDVKEEAPKEDVWDKYSAPEPEKTQEESKPAPVVSESPAQPIQPEAPITEEPQVQTPPEPVIPEPEDTTSKDLENIYQQIQQTKEEENQTGNQVVKE